MNDEATTREALRLVELARSSASRSAPGGLGSTASALALLLKGAVGVLDAAGRNEGRELHALVERAADLVGPGGLAALDHGDFAGAVEAIMRRQSEKAQAAAIELLRSKWPVPKS